MHLGEPPRSELVIRVIPRAMVPNAQWDGRQVRRLLAQAAGPGMGCLDRTGGAADAARKPPDPLQVCRIAYWAHPSAPPQRVASGNQAGSRDSAAINPRLDRPLVHPDLRVPYLCENGGALFDFQPIQQPFP